MPIHPPIPLRDLTQDEFDRLDAIVMRHAYAAQNKLGRLFDERVYENEVAQTLREAGHEVLLATGLGATETGPFALMCTEPQEAPGNIGVPSLGLTLKLVPEGDKLDARIKGPAIMPGATVSSSPAPGCERAPRIFRRASRLIRSWRIRWDT